LAPCCSAEACLRPGAGCRWPTRADRSTAPEPILKRRTPSEKVSRRRDGGGQRTPPWRRLLRPRPTRVCPPPSARLRSGPPRRARRGRMRIPSLCRRKAASGIRSRTASRSAMSAAADHDGMWLACTRCFWQHRRL
jgi:hypothetical protein